MRTAIACRGRRNGAREGITVSRGEGGKALRV